MIHLTQSDQDKISEAVREAELLTTGEIVPMVVTQSDDYPGARWRLAIVTAMFFGFLGYYFLGDFDPAWILWVQIPGLYIGYCWELLALYFAHSWRVPRSMKRSISERCRHLFHSTCTRQKTALESSSWLPCLNAA